MVEVQAIRKMRKIKYMSKLGPKLPATEEKLDIQIVDAQVGSAIGVLSHLFPPFDQEKKVYIRSSKYRVQNHSLELLDY